jgi:hypothetical protein
MYRYFTLITVLTVTILLSSCAGIPKQSFISKTTFESDRLRPIRSIAILDVPNPPHYYLGGGIGPATFFLGGLGAAIELSSVDKDTKEYRDFNFAEITQQRLKKHLEAKGYHVILVRTKRGDQYKLLDNYSSINIPGVDAFLDLVPVEVGFKRKAFAGPFSKEIGPHVSMVFRLISSNSKKVLYTESVQYGYDKNPFASGTKIDSPPNHKFKNTNAMKAHKQKSFKQLVQGIDTLSRVIAKRLPR